MYLSIIVQVAYFVWLYFWDSPSNYVKQCSYEDCMSSDLGGCDADQCVEPYVFFCVYTLDEHVITNTPTGTETVPTLLITIPTN